MKKHESPPNFISRFAEHPVAANILMIIMLLLGGWSIARMNVQFLPNFSLHSINVSIEWPGASASDFTQSITSPLEQKFKQIEGVKQVTSTNRRNVSTILLEFDEATNLIIAQDKVKQRINEASVIPTSAKPPRVTILDHHELIAKILIATHGPRDELRTLTETFKNELTTLGYAKVEVSGIPKQELEIAIPSYQMQSLGLSLVDLSQLIKQQSHHGTMGLIGQGTLTKTLRSDHQGKNRDDFNQMIIRTSAQTMPLRSMASVDLVDKLFEPELFYYGQNAATIALYRKTTASALESANQLHEWLKEKHANANSGITIKPYFESWQLILERIMLLLSNGFWGLLFILTVLFLFLQARVAVWVAIGIPTSFLAGLGALYFAGGTINMVSLFAIIMTLGFIVDDTIVVGEEILSRLQAKVPLIEAIKGGVKEMAGPICASSLTTTAAFFPLMLIQGNMGQILFAIPLVVICVILASLVECFFVLPGHLYHSYQHIAKPYQNHVAPLHHLFVKLQQGPFAKASQFALQNRSTVLAAAFGAFLLSTGLIIGNKIPFSFFPSPDGIKIEAQATFIPGTPQHIMRAYLDDLTKSLDTTNIELNGPESLTQLAISRLNQKGINLPQKGANFVSVVAELLPPDQREITNQMFIDAWSSHIPQHPMIDKITVLAPRGGPPGQDIDIAISGQNITHLKQAASLLKADLGQRAGVFNVQDDLPEGKETISMDLRPQAYQQHISQADLSEQVASAYQGRIIQRYYEGSNEIDVVVRLPNHERFDLMKLNHLPIKVTNNEVTPLSNLASLAFSTGYDVIKQQDGSPTIHVTASIDPKRSNANQIISELQQHKARAIEDRFHVRLAYEGKAKEQRETLADMRFGLLIALAMIYIILATIFSSYSWPLIIMSIIPIGLTGGIFGHYLLGIDFTILSLFGFFGLSGIVINDSIILVNRYRLLRDQESSLQKAMLKAMSQRLRPVMLTSLTTIVGLLPLIFESSLQAQFLIPMAVTICFGLLYATLLVLFVVPAAMLSYELRFSSKHAVKSRDTN